MLTNWELLRKSVATGKQVIFSTGMSTQAEIDHAVEVLRIAKKDFNIEKSRLSPSASIKISKSENQDFRSEIF